LGSLSLIIPCYNEAPDVLQETIAGIHAAMQEVPAVVYEILVVNDGSTKYTYDPAQIDAQGARLIQHRINQGYGASLKTGITHAQHDWIAITDADGTYPNARFGDLIKASAGYDMVIGARSWGDIGWLRRMPKWVLTRFTSFLAKRDIQDLNSGMRIFRKSLAHQFWPLFPSGFSFTSTITMGAVTNGWEVAYVPIDYFKREGQSTLHPIKDTIRFFTLVSRLAMYFSPSRFFVPMSLILAILAVLRGLRDYWLTSAFGGLTLVLFFMAFQVFFFGLIADIISKTRR
jgi:glycosyltransferase involved in cell wall biosynthesis